MTARMRLAAAILAVSILGSRSECVSDMNQAGNPQRPSAAAAGDSLTKRNEKILLYERSFRPSTYDTPVRLPAVNTQSSQLPVYENRTTYAAPETVQGYRIQVLNTNSYDESAAMKNALLSAFDTWWVYVMFDAPTYRVRIGDFQSRLETKNALEQIQAKGFSNAQLVPDKVIIHLPPRLPLPAPIDTTQTK